MNYNYLIKNTIIYLLILIFIVIILLKIYYFKTTIGEGIKDPTKQIRDTVEDAYNKVKNKVKDAVNKVKDKVTKAIKETGVIQGITNRVKQLGNLIDQAIQTREVQLARKYLAQARTLATDAGARRRFLNISIATGMEQLQEAREAANELKEDARQTAEQELQSSLNDLQQIQQTVNEAVDGANQIVNQAAQAIEDLAEMLDFENLLKGLLEPIEKLVNTTNNSFNFLKDF